MSILDAKEALANQIAEELLTGRQDAIPVSFTIVSRIERLIEEIVKEIGNQFLETQSNG